MQESLDAKQPSLWLKLEPIRINDLLMLIFSFFLMIRFFWDPHMPIDIDEKFIKNCCRIVIS
jgi:hypothetical protein